MEFKQYYSIVLQKGLCAKMMELGHVWESWLQSSISYMLWDRSFKSTWRKSSTSTQTFGIIVKFADWAMVMFQDASLPSSSTLLLSWAEYRAGHFPNCLNLFLGSKSLKLANATCTPYVENLLAKFQIRFKAFEVEGASCNLFLYPFFCGTGRLRPNGVAGAHRHTLLLTTIHWESLLDIYKSLHKSKYRILAGNTLKLASPLWEHLCLWEDFLFDD